MMARADFFTVFVRTPCAIEVTCKVSNHCLSSTKFDGGGKTEDFSSLVSKEGVLCAMLTDPRLPNGMAWTTARGGWGTITD